MCKLREREKGRGRGAKNKGTVALSILRIYWKSFLSAERRIGRISFHWKRLRKRKKVEWNWNQGRGHARRGWQARDWERRVTVNPEIGRKKGTRKWKEVANRRFCLFKSLLVHSRKLAVANNKGTEFNLCVTRELVRNTFFYFLTHFSNFRFAFPT